MNSINVLWLFITNSLVSNEINHNQASLTDEETSAKKDFGSFYIQTINKDQTSDELLLRKMSTISSNSILSISDQCNLPLEWIIYSLRQNILLNQLTFLVGDEKNVRNYYKSSAFLLDRSFADDFLNYIRAYELRDFNILSRVKRNFFNIEPQSVSGYSELFYFLKL